MKHVYFRRLPLAIFLLLAYFLNTVDAAGSVQIQLSQSSINFSPVTYSFTLNAVSFTNVPQSSTIQIDFPTDYTGILPASPTCTDDSGTSLTCGLSGRKITITNFFTSALFDNVFKFKITNIKNPSHTGSTGTFTAAIVSPTSTSLVDGSGTISISEASAVCTVSTASNVNGATTTITFNIVTTTAIPANGGLEITLPWWSLSGESMVSNPSSYTCKVTSPSTSTPGSCTLQTLSSGTKILATSILSTSVPSGATLTFEFQSIKNPPISNTYSITLRTLDTSNSGLDLCTIGLRPTVPNAITVNPSSFLTCITNANKKEVNLMEVCILSFTTTNPLPSGANINVRFPNEVTVSATFRVNEDKPYSITSVTQSSSAVFPDVLLTNAVTSYTSGGTSFDLRFFSMKHPGTTKPTTSFQISTSFQGSAIDSLTTGASYSAAPGDILSLVISSSPTSETGSTSQVTFAFNIENAVSSSSQVRIVFPSEFSVSTSPVTCSASGTKMNSSPTCSITSKTVTISNYAASNLVSLDPVRVTVNNMILPQTTKPTSTAFEVYTMDGGFDVDREITTTFQASVAVITSGLALSIQTGAEVAGTSDYELTFITKNPIPIGGKFIVGLPSDGTVTISSQLQVESGTQLSIAGTVRTVATTVTTSSVPTLTFSNPTLAEISAGTTIKVTIPQLKNPPSTAITSSFTVRTTTSDNFGIDSVTSGLNVPANAISPSNFQLVNIVASPSSTGSDSVYTFRVVPKVLHTSSHILSITFPTTITIKATATCQVSKPVAKSALSCPPSGSNEITLSFAQDVAALDTFEFQVTGIVNPKSAGTYSGFSLASKISTAKVHQTTGTVSVSIDASTLTDISFTRSSKLLSQPSIFTFTFVPKNSYPSTAYIEIIVPSQLSVRTSPALQCGDIQGMTQPPTCQLKASTTRTIQVTNAGGYSTSRIKFSLDSLINQAAQIDSDSFVLSVKDSTGATIDEKTTGLEALSPCHSSCLTCQDDNRLACTSCSIGKLFDTVNFKCVDTCPSKTFLEGTQCKACNSKCLECEGSGETQCSSCNTTSSFPYSYRPTKECRTVCPDTFYGDSSFICQSCVSPCETCSSSTVCKSCVSGTYFLNGSCGTLCANGYYKEDTSRRCLQCKSACLTCSAFSTCTSCDTSSKYKIFFNSDCIEKCSDGYYASDNTCKQCTSPCATCTLLASNCLSCTPGLYLDNAVCMPCSSPCKTCIGKHDSCSSCSTGLFLQGTKCTSVCNDGYFANYGTQTCDKCPDGCVSCSSASKCTNCNATSTTPFLYYDTCVSSCPGDAPIVINRQCLVNTNPITERVNPYQGLYRFGLPFPFIIFSLIFSILCFIGKMVSEKTLIVSNILGFVSLIEFASWIALAFLLILSHPDESVGNYTGLPLVVIGIVASVVINIVFFFKVLRHLAKSDSFVTWKNQKRGHKVFLIIMYVFSFLSFKCFRLIYSRFFGLMFMSVQLPDPRAFLSTFNKFLGLNFFLGVLPAFIAAVVTIHKDSDFSQLRNIAIEIILIVLFTIALAIYEALKPSDLDKVGIISPEQESVMGRLNVNEPLNGKNSLRKPGSLKAHGIKRGGNDDGAADENDPNGSSLIHMNSVHSDKRADLSIDSKKNEESFLNPHADDSKIEAIEEIDKEDEDEEPALNMKNKTLGKLRQILKSRGQELKPEKILIENKDGSIIVLRDPNSARGSQLESHKGSADESFLRALEDGTNKTMFPIEENVGEGTGAIPINRALTKNSQKPGNGTDKKADQDGSEGSEEELELHDSFENVGQKLRDSKKRASQLADDKKEAKDLQADGRKGLGESQISARGTNEASKQIDSMKNSKLHTDRDGKGTSEGSKQVDGMKNSRLHQDRSLQVDTQDLPSNKNNKKIEKRDEDVQTGDMDDYVVVNSAVSKRDNFSSPVDVSGSPGVESAGLFKGSDGKQGSPDKMIKKGFEGNRMDGNEDEDEKEAEGQQKNTTGGNKKSPNKGDSKNTKKDDDQKFEYVSSDSQITAEDMNDHFHDDTPSNYNVLNQRYDEDAISPKSLTKPKYDPNPDMLKKVLGSSPPKPAFMGNFIESQQDIIIPNQARMSGGNSGRDLPPKSLFKADQDRATLTSYGKPMGGEKKIIAQAGMQLVSPQYKGGLQQIKEDRNDQGRKSATPGTRSKASVSPDRKNDLRDSQRSRSKQTDKVNTEKLNELENLYSPKKKDKGNSSKPPVPQNVKKQVYPQKSFDDDFTDNDGLELNNFEKFENFVNGMKQQSDDKKFDGESFEKDNI